MLKVQSDCSDANMTSPIHQSNSPFLLLSNSSSYALHMNVKFSPAPIRSKHTHTGLPVLLSSSLYVTANVMLGGYPLLSTATFSSLGLVMPPLLYSTSAGFNCIHQTLRWLKWYMKHSANIHNYELTYRSGW